MDLLSLTARREQAAIRSLALHGPLTDTELADLVDLDPDDALAVRELDNLVAQLVGGYTRIVALDDERLADVVSLLAETTFTRRLTAEEVAGGYVLVEPDLVVFVELATGSLPLTGGGRLHLSFGTAPGGPQMERLAGPTGWLGDPAEGDLVGLRLVDGAVDVVSRPHIDDAVTAAAAFGEVLRRHIAVKKTPGGSVRRGRDDPKPFDFDLDIDLDEDLGVERVTTMHALVEAISAEPFVFRGVLPPVQDLAREAGFKAHARYCVPRYADWSDVQSISDVLFDIGARSEFDLYDEEMLAFRALRTIWRGVARGRMPAAADIAAITGALECPNVVEAFVRQSNADAAAQKLAEAVLPDVAGEAKGGALYVLARAAEERGDTPVAEACLHHAVTISPQHHPALEDAAWFAEDRGDAATALRCLRRARFEDDSHMVRLRARMPRVRHVGPNEPCPCDSGRKYKQCCGAPAHGPLVSRASWVVDKLLAYLARPRQTRRLVDGPLAEPGRLPPGWEKRLSAPLGIDLAVFDLGILESFLADRGELLPDDERELAESWRQTARAVWQVTAANAYEATLKRHDSGETVVVPMPEDSSPLEAGTWLLGRVLPDGGGGHLLWAAVFLGTPDEPGVDVALDPGADPVAVAERWVAPPPVLSTADEQLVEQIVRTTPDSGPPAPPWRVVSDIMQFGVPPEPRAAADELAAVEEFEDAAGVSGFSPMSVRTLVDLPLTPETREDRERRAFAVPPASGTYEGVDLALLDRANENDRPLFIGAEHAGVDDVLAHWFDPEIDSEATTPKAHLAMHATIAGQLWDDNPPQVWVAAKRLLALGYERHDILHMLASAMSTELWDALASDEPFAQERYRKALEDLPGPRLRIVPDGE